jgi:hypothetical protein
MPQCRLGFFVSFIVFLTLVSTPLAPGEARRLPLRGCAVVKFNIDANGATSNVILIKGSDLTISERLKATMKRMTFAPKERASLPLRNQLLTFSAVPQPRGTDVYVTFGGASPVFKECEVQQKYPPSSYRIVTKDYMNIFHDILI